MKSLWTEMANLYYSLLYGNDSIYKISVLLLLFNFWHVFLERTSNMKNFCNQISQKRGIVVFELMGSSGIIQNLRDEPRYWRDEKALRRRSRSWLVLASWLPSHSHHWCGTRGSGWKAIWWKLGRFQKAEWPPFPRQQTFFPPCVWLSFLFNLLWSGMTPQSCLDF